MVGPVNIPSTTPDDNGRHHEPYGFVTGFTRSFHVFFLLRPSSVGVVPGSKEVLRRWTRFGGSVLRRRLPTGVTGERRRVSVFGADDASFSLFYPSSSSRSSSSFRSLFFFFRKVRDESKMAADECNSTGSSFSIPPSLRFFYFVLRPSSHNFDCSSFYRFVCVWCVCVCVYRVFMLDYGPTFCWFVFWTCLFDGTSFVCLFFFGASFSFIDFRPSKTRGSTLDARPSVTTLPVEKTKRNSFVHNSVKAKITTVHETHSNSVKPSKTQ